MKKFSQVRILFSLAVPSFAGLCLSFNGFAVVLIPGDIETVIAASKTQPDKLYILEVGGEWCPFCTQEQKWLKESPGPEAKKAVWYHLEANEENFSRFREQALAHGIRFSTAVPYNIVFKNGLPVASAYGFKAAELEAFLSEAAIVQPSELWALSANISSYDTHFLCGPVAGEGSDECVFGLLGEFPESEPTDDFGRGNLRAFSELFEDPAYRQLIATPTFESVPIQATLNRIINPQLEYDFYVPNPMSLFDAQLIDPLAEGYDFQSWIDAPGESARLMLTGHGRRDGIPLKVYANGKSQEELLTPDQFKEISAQIRSSGPGSPNGKTLRAIVTTCFGGKFGSGFMPMPGVKQQACAAFSSLPNKYAEGCYQNDFLTEKRDYLATAARFKKCDGSQDARQLHYNVVLNSEGFDIPMLSSDYFLQYGPGFDYFRKKYGVNFWSDVQDLITDHLIHDTFKSAHNVRDLVKRIQEIAIELKALDPEAGDALFQLTSKIQTYKLQGRAGVYFSEGFVAPTEDTTDPEPFAIQDFFNALYFNNDNTDFDEQPRMNPYLSRMASLVVSASVELELRRLSPKDPEAKKLVNHLDAMKDCERTLL